MKVLQKFQDEFGYYCVTLESNPFLGTHEGLWLGSTDTTFRFMTKPARDFFLRAARDHEDLAVESHECKRLQRIINTFVTASWIEVFLLLRQLRKRQ